jgi:PIN domain nuclease of toxin-antitoxin system
MKAFIMQLLYFFFCKVDCYHGHTIFGVIIRYLDLLFYSLVQYSSAIIALIEKEPGAEAAEPYVVNALTLTVNFTEVVGYFSRRIESESALRSIVRPFTKNIVPYDAEMAFMAGHLVCKTRHLGLSLGDRACLALGITKKLPVFTADRLWAKLNLPVEVQLLR